MYNFDTEGLKAQSIGSITECRYEGRTGTYGEFKEIAEDLI